MDLEQTYMKVLNDIIKKCEKVYKKRTFFNALFSTIHLPLFHHTQIHT